MTEFSKGPWAFTKANDQGGNGADNISIKDAEGNHVIGGCGCCGSPWTDNKHNLPLITTSPELYEACVFAIESGDREAVVERMLAVTAKARGWVND